MTPIPTTAVRVQIKVYARGGELKLHRNLHTTAHVSEIEEWANAISCPEEIDLAVERIQWRARGKE